jgi:hypothetical protein
MGLKVFIWIFIRNSSLEIGQTLKMQANRCCRLKWQVLIKQILFTWINYCRYGRSGFMPGFLRLGRPIPHIFQRLSLLFYVPHWPECLPIANTPPIYYWKYRYTATKPATRTTLHCILNIILLVFTTSKNISSNSYGCQFVYLYVVVFKFFAHWTVLRTSIQFDLSMYEP